MRHHKLFWGSSYDRGLQILLKLWPKILENFPDAELHICYGWNTFDDFFKDNPERMAWKNKINEQMTQKGIIHHGRIGKDELKKLRQSCGIWAYTCTFPEINCITALETQSDGVVPCTVDDYALKETVQSGFKVDGDIYEPETQEKWLQNLFTLMSSDEKWSEESKKAIAFANQYSWDKVSQKWEEYL